MNEITPESGRVRMCWRWDDTEEDRDRLTMDRQREVGFRLFRSLCECDDNGEFEDCAGGVSKEVG